MTTLTKRRIVLTSALVISTGLIVAIYILNGSEKEDLWLYISSVAVPIAVIIPEIIKK